MPFQDRGLCLALGAIIAVSSLTASFAGSVTIPHTFAAGQKASASQVNDNFAAVATAVNDNDTRITRVESYIQARPPKHRHAVPAAALSIAPAATQTVIAPQANGLLWQADYSRDARIWLEKPLDYKPGTDVTFSILFEVTTATAGSVQFFIRPQSFDSGDTEYDPQSITAPPLAVAGTSSYGFGTIYRQDVTIPASRFLKDNWLVKIQRVGAPTETYGDPVLFLSGTLEYEIQ
jgi:hypothetical protein